MHLLVSNCVRRSPTTEDLLVGNTPPHKKDRVLISPYNEEQDPNKNRLWFVT